MRDKRAVNQLSIDELERILVLRKREARQEHLRRFGRVGRRLPMPSPIDTPLEPLVSPPQQHEAAEDVPPVEPPVTYDITDDIPRFEDEIEAEVKERHKKEQPKPPPALPSAWNPYAHIVRRRATWDKLLLVVEVLAVVGIVAVLAGGAYLLIIENGRIAAIEEKSASIQREAAAMRSTPTPMPDLQVKVSDYVLPGGHYSPDITAGEPAFNLEELPASVRPMVMAQLMAPQAERGTPQPSSPIRIVIDSPKVQVDASIYGGDDWYQLIKGVGHYTGSANPGENGNLVLSAHNDILGETFRDIQYLQPGDEIRIQANDNRWYTYVVYDKQVVNPSDVWVLQRGNEPVVTLITCHPYRVDTKRMVVFGKLVQNAP
jgi:sortase A